MRVLLVVPDVSRFGKRLQVADEIYYASLYSDATVLSGSRATVKNVIQAITDGDYRMLQISTEAVESHNKHVDRLAMSDGEISMGQLGQALAGSPVSVVFLNACNTGLIGAFLVYTGAVDACVITNVPIPDKSAWEVPYQFYNNTKEALDSGDRIESMHWGRILKNSLRMDQIGWYAIVRPLDAPPLHSYYTREMLRDVINRFAMDIVEDRGDEDNKLRNIILSLLALLTLSVLLMFFLAIGGAQ